MSTGLFFFYLKSWRVGFKICLVTSYYISIMFNFVRNIALDIFGTMHIIHKDSVILFPAIFALKNTQVHACTMNYTNMTFYIKVSINKIFSFKTALSILYINPDNSHIRFGRYFDYLRSKDKNNIIEDVCGLNDFF